MSSGGGSSKPATNPTTTQKPVTNPDTAANEAAQKVKQDLEKGTTSSESTILTSGAGVLDEPTYKKTKLGAGLLTDYRGQALG